MRTLLRAAGGVFLAAAAVLSLGCGQAVGTVSGTVTYNGTPVFPGQVELVGKDNGVPAVGPLDGSGNFTLDVPLPVGEYQVRVTPGWDEPGKTPPPRGKATAGIPKKAQEFTSSGLTVTVNKGSNTVTLELKD
jgi:hypothetical protein